MGRRKVNREELKKSSKIETKIKRRNLVKEDKNNQFTGNNFYNDSNLNSKIEVGIEILNNQKAKEKIERENRIKSNKEKRAVPQETVRYEVNKVFIGIIILIVVIIFYSFFEFGPIFGISLNKTVAVKDEKSIDIITSSEDIYDEYMSELLIYSNHKVYTYNKNSKKTWEYSLEEQFTPNIYIKDKYLAINNNSTGNIYLFEDKKEILNMKIDGSISNLYFDESGNFAVDYSTNEYKKIIGVYDKKGNLLYNTYPLAKSIIHLELINNASQLLIVETSSNSFKTGLDVYMIDSKLSTNETNKIANIDNCFAYDFIKVKDNLIMLLDNQIISCNINTGSINKIKTFDSNQMLFVGLSKNYYFSVEKELNNSETYNFNTKLLDDETIGNLELKVSPKLVKTSKLLNYIVYQNEIQVINKWGVEVKDIVIESNPKEIIPFGRKNVALIYTNKVYIINL